MVDETPFEAQSMVAELVACTVLFLAAGAELLHVARSRRIAPLAFGPRRRPMAWVYTAPMLRVFAVTAVTWGLITLMMLPPRVHQIGEKIPDHEMRHLVIVLDVSPSMRLQDGGPEKKQSRRQRVYSLMDSFFKRVALPEHKISVIAVYNGAKPVVEDTRDFEVVRNILNDLPMEYAFKSGKTDIFRGLELAAKTARPWRPNSTTIILLSDGDTVPATGMPKMPAAVRDVVVVGVGDHVQGKFIDGRQSRQDASTLRQIAVRLKGDYHNGNEKHISTAIVKKLSQVRGSGKLEALTRREYALITCGTGAAIYALLPLLLQFGGTTWRPGTRSHSQPERRVAVS